MKTVLLSLRVLNSHHQLDWWSLSTWAAKKNSHGLYTRPVNFPVAKSALAWHLVLSIRQISRKNRSGKHLNFEKSCKYLWEVLTLDIEVYRKSVTETLFSVFTHRRTLCIDSGDGFNSVKIACYVCTVEEMEYLLEYFLGKKKKTSMTEHKRKQTKANIFLVKFPETRFYETYIPFENILRVSRFMRFDHTIHTCKWKLYFVEILEILLLFSE